MKCELFFIGKTTEKYLQEGIENYLKRLKHYLPVVVTQLNAGTGSDPGKIISSESMDVLSRIKPRDYVVLLDERGQGMQSTELANKMQQWMLQGFPRIIFIIGGAYGVNEELRKRANTVLSFSSFTFTHQMIRLFLVEQIYRAMTILKNESYHHGG